MGGRRARDKESDGRQFRWLLRVRRERPCGYTAAKKRDEVPPPHGAYPKAKDHGLSIAGLGAGSGPLITAKTARLTFAARWINARTSHRKPPLVEVGGTPRGPIFLSPPSGDQRLHERVHIDDGLWLLWLRRPMRPRWPAEASLARGRI